VRMAEAIHIRKWAETVHREIEPFHLGGVRVRCPVCEEHGSATSRWVKGEPIKPVYVIHNHNGTVKHVCTLTETEAEAVRPNVRIPPADVGRIMRKAQCFVLISGGKDSLATLVYAKGIADSARAELRAIHCDTTCGFPEVTSYVRKVCRHLGVRLSIVKPEKDFFDMARSWGLPNFRFRWCCRELKIKPLQAFLAKIRGKKVVIDGIRAEESYLRAKYLPVWYHPSFKCLSVSLIFRWSKKRVERYVEEADLPENPIRKLGCSAECWCGAYKQEADFLKLKEIKPELFDKLADLEAEVPTGFTFLYKNGKRTPLRELSENHKPTT